ncbi:MAG: PIN domain-containing protein [Nanoarchaeota archaeon]
MTNSKTLIILDTNFLREGNQSDKIYSILSSRSDFREFIDFLEKNNLKKEILFGIPEITFEEHFYYKNKDFNSDLDYLKEKVLQFNHMEILINDRLDLKFREDYDYKKYLKGLIEKNPSFLFLYIEDNKKKDIFEKVLKKAINHEKPFHKKGDRNLKDSIIWECICCQDFREYASVIFLTQNEDDFPKNNEIQEINLASEKTGKIINIVYKYEDLKKELEKIYMFKERKLKEYILTNVNIFEEKIKNWILDEDGIPFKNLKLTKPCEEIEFCTDKDLEDIGLIMSNEKDGEILDLDNLRFIKVEFEAELDKNAKYSGEVLYDLSTKEILHVKWTIEE